MSYSTKLTKEQLHYNIIYQIRATLKDRGIEYTAKDLTAISNSVETVLKEGEEKWDIF